MSASDIFDVEKNPFRKELRGSFGIVKTDTSNELNFVLSSLDIGRISDLETASSALNVQFAEFGDLLQRDIDMVRVAKITKDYLEQGKNKTVFFPPLLASLVAFADPKAGTKGTTITECYKNVDDTTEDGWVIRTWDKDRFQLRLRSTNSREGSVPFFHDGKQIDVFSFGCTLKWNDAVVKLVVIDGQHRLSALKNIYNDINRQHILENMHIPICVVFPPNAKVHNPRGESIRVTLRELFVTINEAAVAVSGHFLILLDDKSLSAVAIRSLAESWKATALGDGLTKLHLLEWNQRQNSKTNQITKAYSLTTVSIIAEALEKNIFDPKTGGLTRVFLNLTECEGALEKEKTWTKIESISESNFHPLQVKILEKQIKTYITPSLDLLFSEPTPYKNKIGRVIKAKKWLDSEVVRIAAGAQDYRDRCLMNYRKWTELDSVEVQQKEKDFESRCEDDKEDDGPFFLNVFQQGLINAWIEFAHTLLGYDIEPAGSASILVDALEDICFSDSKNYFSDNKAYTRLSLYKDGGAVIVNDTAREQWKRLILMTLRNPSTQNKVVDRLAKKLSAQKRKEFLEKLKSDLDQIEFEFFEDLKNAMQRDFEKNWRDRDPTAEQTNKIQQIIATAAPDSEEFEEYIAKHLTVPKLKKAKTRLRAVLEVEQRE